MYNIALWGILQAACVLAGEAGPGEESKNRHDWADQVNTARFFQQRYASGAVMDCVTGDWQSFHHVIQHSPQYTDIKSTILLNSAGNQKSLISLMSNVECCGVLISEVGGWPVGRQGISVFAGVTDCLGCSAWISFIADASSGENSSSHETEIVGCGS